MIDDGLRIQSDRHLQFVDGLRGIAILLVVSAHLLLYGFGPALRTQLLLTNLAFAGRFGVQLFFMVSAFLLFGRLQDRCATERSPILNYYVGRAFRILPPWWLAIALYCVLQGRHLRSAVPEFAFYFGFLPNHQTVFDVQWSLFVEESFYILLPWLVSFFSRPKNAAWTFGVLYALHLVWRFAAETLLSGVNYGFLIGAPPMHWYCFALGIMIFHLHRWITSGGAIIAGWVWVALDVITAVCLFEAMPREVGIASLSLALLFCTSLFPETFFGKVVRWRWLGYFGRYAYSIYLLHLIAISVVLSLRPRVGAWFTAANLPLEIEFLFWFVALSSVMLGIGYVCYETFEKASINAGKRVMHALENRKHLCSTPPTQR